MAPSVAPHSFTSISPGSESPIIKDEGLAEHMFRGENEILVDSIGHDLRKGLQLGVDQLMKCHMQGRVEVNACDEFGCYLLMAAAQGGRLDAVRDLLARGALVNQVDDNGNTALHLSVLLGHSNVSTFLLQQGADPGHRNNDGDRPGEVRRERFYAKAFRAVKMGDIHTVLRLVGRDFVPVDLTEEECETSHMVFTPKVFRERCSHNGTFYFELEDEYLPDTSAEGGREGLAPAGAAQQAPEEAIGPDHLPGDEEVTSMPLDTGPQPLEEIQQENVSHGLENSVASESAKRRTLLMYAAAGGHMKLVKVLIRAHANILQEDSSGETAISLSKKNKHFEVARYLNERVPESLRAEIMTEETLELNELRKSFDAFCLLGSANIGGGQQSKLGGRASTMDFLEFLKYLTHIELAGPGKACSKDMAASIFQWQMDVSTASGELEWSNFKQCLHRLANQLHMPTIEGVPTEDLLDRTPVLDSQKDLLRIPLTKVSRKGLQRELEMMQRSLDVIGDRCRDVTSCRYAAYGFGVTTGRHKLRNETFDVYRKLLRAPSIKMKMPKFTKDKELAKKEMLAKQFFNLIDKDRSGSLTRYELQWALDDFGFSKDEQAEVFQMVDADNSGSVTLTEFIAGMGEGTVTFAGRQSKSSKKQSFLEIGLKISKDVNKKEQPVKILSISPGLFGQIFKIFCDYALKERLYNGKDASCLFSAPKLSALMPDKKVVKKLVLGINTRFAVSNPFDPRVLANSGPINLTEVLSFDSPRGSIASHLLLNNWRSSRSSTPNNTSPSGSPIGSSGYKVKVPDNHKNEPNTWSKSPKRASSNHLLQRSTSTESKQGTDTKIRTSNRRLMSDAADEKTGTHEKDRPKTTAGRDRKSMVQDHDTSRPDTSGHNRRCSSHPIKAFEEQDESIQSQDMPLQRPKSVMSADIEARLGTPMQAGSRRATSAVGMVPSLRKRRHLQSLHHEKESPDGNLMSEHTRITLIPHRLTLTKSGQVLVGGAETTDPKTVTSIAALAVQNHRITRSGINILDRLVFKSISFGAGHCAAVTDTGLVYTWGQGRYGQLGHGDESDKIVPQPVRGINGKVKAVSSSFYHNVAITVNGHLFTWGDGREGKLGHNDNAGRLLPCIVSFFVDTGVHIIAAQAGGSHSIALSSFHQTYTFGSGGNGRLGHGNDRDQWLPTMVSALELYKIVSLAAGYAHTAALTDDGQVFTWGSGKLGRLGHGSDSDEVLPRKVALFSHSTIKPLSVAAGEAHTSVLRSDGSMVSVGRVTHGRLAEGVCVGEHINDMQRGIDIQNPEDWHHFPS